jgi:hypothetical protein
MFTWFQQLGVSVCLLLLRAVRFCDCEVSLIVEPKAHEFCGSRSCEDLRTLAKDHDARGPRQNVTRSTGFHFGRSLSFDCERYTEHLPATGKQEAPSSGCVYQSWNGKRDPLACT